MNWLEALILGLLQGLTEFLPVSSSGHLEIGKVILGIEANETLSFTVVVHGATVLSTVVVFAREIAKIIKGLFQFQWNDETKFVVKIIISMIPVLIIGLFFKDQIETLFTGNLVLVGSMLIITALLLSLTHFSQRDENKISNTHAFIIGIAQAIAVIPGISRSGATIATGILLKNKREIVTRFSFLMVLIPIIGANAKDIIGHGNQSIGNLWSIPVFIGFLTAFISGLFACKWMIKIVKKQNLIYFAIYCFLIGLAAILYSIF